MRRVLWVTGLLLLGFPATGGAQDATLGGQVIAQPGTTRLYTDEELVAMPRERIPVDWWLDVVRCGAQHGLTPIPSPIPDLTIVPTDKFQVYDALLVALDSTWHGRPAGAVIAWSLVRYNRIVITARYAKSENVVKHELLHHVVWRAAQQVGHPEVFARCGWW